MINTTFINELEKPKGGINYGFLDSVEAGDTPAIQKTKASQYIAPPSAPAAIPQQQVGLEIPEMIIPKQPFDPSGPPSARQLAPVQMEIGPTPERTVSQKIGDFFIGKPEDRPFLPSDAGRMEKIDHAIKSVASMPVRAFVKFGKGLLLGTPDLAWAAIKKVTPQDLWDENVKNMSLDEAMDWAMGYNPSGFSRSVSGLAEFFGAIKTVGGLRAKPPKSLTVIDRALRSGQTFALAKMGRELSKFGAELIDPETDYKYEGAASVMVDFGIGAGFSLLGSASRPVLKTIAKSRMGKAISEEAHKVVINLTKRFPELMDTVRPNPSKYFQKEVLRALKQRTGISVKDMTPLEKAVLRHIAREGERRFKQALKNYVRPPDIVYRGKAPAGAKLLPGAQALVAPPVRPAVAPVAVPPAKAPIPPKPTEAIVEPPAKMAGPKAPEAKVEPWTPELEALAKRDNYYRTKTGNVVEAPATLTPDYKDLSLADLVELDPKTVISVKQYSGRRGGANRRKIKVGNLILPPKVKPPVAPTEGKVEIVSAAVKVDNQIYTGDTHSEALDSARKKLSPDAELLDFIATANIQSSTGFMTNKKQYVESDEALVIAKTAGQRTKEKEIELSIAEAEEAGTFLPPTAKEPVPLRGPVTVSGKEYRPVQLPTESIGVDAEKFQFKLGAKLVGGVTEAMKGVEKWDPIKGGNILVWQDKAGKHWVVDGHHRVALANKTNQPTMDTWVVSEVDGWSAAEARAIGAMRNLADGKGTAVDAAKLFRDTKLDLDQLKKQGVPTNNIVVEQGMAMKDLSDEVFKLVVNERLPANYAAVIGRNVKDPTQQKQVADLILQGDVDSVRQAELLAITIDNAPVLTKSEMTLFGLETTEKSLYAERAKILANVEKKLKTNQKVFGTLSKQVGLIEAKGNILAKEENIRAKERADEVLYLLEKFATLKGPVAEALNDATKEYARNPTKENLSKITNDLISRWTQATTGLSVQNVQGLLGLSAKRAEPEIKGKPGFIDVALLANTHKVFMDIIEPSKAVEIKLGKPVYATVIKGVHKADVARIEFNEQQIETLDGKLEKFTEKLSRYSNKVLDNLMLARGHPKDKAAISIQNDALKDLAKNNPELIGTRKIMQRIADSNYTYLQSVVGDDIKYMEDYFYGIYKSTPEAKIDGFIDYWKTTKRFTKEKKLPTYADAKAYGLQIRDPNPINNLMSEYTAIARLDGMIQMRDELLRTGKGEYIWPKEEAPPHSDKVPEPVFKDVRMDPDLAALIKKLISTNKVYRYPVLNTLRKFNNAVRTLKFSLSMFHHLSIAKQSIADEGYLAFFQKSALRGITTGFKKNDPRFKTAKYKWYIEHGGGHRYSIESEAQRAFTNFIEKLDKRLGIAFKVGAIGVRIPKTYIKWLFQSYIPEVKYSKYCDAASQMEEKLGRELTSAETIDIIKEGQNFYGMMNERLFGRSGTTTTALRFLFMSPGYAEGNVRTNLKAALQWGGKEGWKANRSRSNIVNSLLLTATAATVGTLILTDKPPKRPESREDIRDLFKIDTGRVDDKGRRIMIDLLTYDRDYWRLYGNLMTGQFEKALKAPWKRIQGMKAGTFDIAVDLANIVQGKAVIDYKNDVVVEVTDPFFRQILQFAIYEIKKLEPISVSVFRRSRARKLDVALAALSSLSGFRSTLTEKDKREQAELRRMWDLKGRQEELYNYLASLRNPRASVERYNQTVRNILDNVSPKIAAEWRTKLIIDTQRYLENKAYYISQKNRTPKEIERAKRILKGFGVTEDDLQLYLNRYWQRERKKPVRTVESIPIIGRNIKRKRAAERYK